MLLCILRLLAVANLLDLLALLIIHTTATPRMLGFGGRYPFPLLHKRHYPMEHKIRT